MNGAGDSPLIFADLDDTLFQTKRKVPADQVAGLIEAARARDDDPSKTSFMTARQQALTNWLLKTAELIPVTARSEEAYRRVQIPFASWAVVANGALILEPGGTPHAAWGARMADALAPARPHLLALLQAGRASAEVLSLDMRSWIVSEGDLDAYVVFKLNDPDRQDGQGLEKLDFGSTGLDLSGWVHHRNGNNLALIPPGLGKRHAVAYLLKQLDPDRTRPTLGAGDSSSDLDFMGLTDFAVIPRAAQAGTLLWQKP